MSSFLRSLDCWWTEERTGVRDEACCIELVKRENAFGWNGSGKTHGGLGNRTECILGRSAFFTLHNHGEVESRVG